MPTYGLSLNLVPTGFRNSNVVEFSPNFLSRVEDVRPVMTAICLSLVDKNGMETVGNLIERENIRPCLMLAMQQKKRFSRQEVVFKSDPKWKI